MKNRLPRKLKKKLKKSLKIYDKFDAGFQAILDAYQHKDDWKMLYTKTDF